MASTEELTGALRDSETQNVSTYLGREAMAERLGITASRLRPYCEAPGADVHFRSALVRGKRVYPPESVSQFREALMVPPRTFGGMLSKMASGELVPITPSPLVPVPEASPVALLHRLESLTEKLNESLTQIVSRVPAPEDSLLTAPEVREILRGPIPKSLRPVAKSPARWSRQQINRHILSLLSD